MLSQPRGAAGNPLLLAACERDSTIHMGREMFIEMGPLYRSLFGYDSYSFGGIRTLVGYQDYCGLACAGLLECEESIHGNDPSPGS